MDVWLAKSEKPTPVLVSIHGGGFRGGNKSVSGGLLKDTYKHPALPQLFGADLEKLDDLPKEKYKLFEEVSALPHLTKDDAPALLIYGTTMETPITSQNIYTCAVVRSTTKVLYGYFEVRAKAMNSAARSISGIEFRIALPQSHCISPALAPRFSATEAAILPQWGG